MISVTQFLTQKHHTVPPAFFNALKTHNSHPASSPSPNPTPIHSENVRVPTFIRNEPKVAAYLGFTNVGDFRKYRFSWPILKWYLVFQQHCPLSKDRDASMFANNAEDLVALYSVETATRRSETRHSKTYIHAGILFHMRRDLETGNIYDKTLQRRFQKDFQEKFNITILPYNIITVVKGDLSPFVKYGEHQLEPYSRVCALIRSLQHVITPSKWDDIFVKKKDKVFFPNVSIGQDAVPSWMREIDTTQSLIAGGLMPRHSEKPNTASEALIYTVNQHRTRLHSQSHVSHMSNKHSHFLITLV